jgi:uncharacterized membrane protein YGL010W
MVTHISSVSVSSRFSLLSTEPGVIRWALDEIHAHGGPDVYSYGTHTLVASEATTEFGMRVLAGLVNKGWVVFSIEHGVYHLRKQFAQQSSPT